MIVATILLDTNNKYLKDDGSLPSRPVFDKRLLTGLCRGNRVTEVGYRMLPLSIRGVLEIDNKVPNMPITVPEIAKADLLIVSRSVEVVKGGKVFRLDDFEPLALDLQLEIWRRK